MKKEYVEGKAGVAVELQISEKKGTIKLSAYVIDPESRKRLSSVPRTCKVANKNDLAVKKAGLISRACGDWAKKNRGKGTKEPLVPLAPPTIVKQAFALLDQLSPYFLQRWGSESTRKNAFIFFERNTIPFVEKYVGSTCTRADVEVFFTELKEKAAQNGHSKGNDGQLRRSVNKHLSEAMFIYAEMRKKAPELPEIDFSPFYIGRYIQCELAKSLPERVRERLAVYLEENVESSPQLVFAAVLMFDGALRTAEAAAQFWSDIKDYGDFGVAVIRFQEKDGKRCAILKTTAAYRNVTLSYWGITLLRRCAEQIGNVDSEGETPLKARAVSAWIMAALLECGIEEEYIRAVRKLMDEEPEYEADGKKTNDFVAYILRKDRTSRWLNICGLSGIDVDYYLGHKSNLLAARKPNFKSIERHRENAKLLENYVYNPMLSAHPFARPIRLAKGQGKDIKATAACTVQNKEEESCHLKMSIFAREPGSVIAIRVPKAKTPTVLTMIPSRRERLDQPVIGKQAIQRLINGSEDKENDD